ncbi:MAG: hypothetical protein ACHP7P_07635 [Terriglobales bacterium]
MDAQADAIKRKRFLWGVLLAWAPFLFFVIGFLSAIRGISSQKATGLGAVAGGISEFLATFGLAVTVVFEVCAIVLLLRAFSRGHSARSFFSVLSLCCSGFMILFLGLFFWVSYLWRSH